MFDRILLIHKYNADYTLNNISSKFSWIFSFYFYRDFKRKRFWYFTEIFRKITSSSNIAALNQVTFKQLYICNGAYL